MFIETRVERGRGAHAVGSVDAKRRNTIPQDSLVRLWSFQNPHDLG
jgi:hypothetical protein